MKRRRLLSTRRTVPKHNRADYDTAWSALVAAAKEKTAHAWRFSALDNEDTYLEFLEFAPEADPRQSRTVAEALERIEAVCRAMSTEEWEEITPQP
ncbi:MAG TPA: hypothetical protein VFI91_05935 [Longimicrobiaceae bacterium]|nr:hypothetical protein [Longimicrobiaceae bacterium]